MIHDRSVGLVLGRGANEVEVIVMSSMGESRNGWKGLVLRCRMNQS